MTCEFCAALTGRFNANRACCQIRLLVGAPAETRRARYAKVKKDDGEAAVTELKQKVRIEYQRQQDYKAAIVREQLERDAAKGREQSSALLKKIKESNMNISPLERAAGATTAPVQEFA